MAFFPEINYKPHANHICDYRHYRKTAQTSPDSDKIPREQFCKKFKYFDSYFILHKTPNIWTLGVTGDKIHEKSLKPAEIFKKIAEFN